MLKIRRPLGRLIFNMGIAIPGKTVFLIETAPWVLKMKLLDNLIIDNNPPIAFTGCLLVSWGRAGALNLIFKGMWSLLDIWYWTFECPMASIEYPADYAFLMFEQWRVFSIKSLIIKILHISRICRCFMQLYINTTIYLEDILGPCRPA